MHVFSPEAFSHNILIQGITKVLGNTNMNYYLKNTV